MSQRSNFTDHMGQEEQDDHERKREHSAEEYIDTKDKDTSEMFSNYARVVAAKNYDNFTDVGRTIRDDRYLAIQAKKALVPSFDEIYRNYGVATVDAHQAMIDRGLADVQSTTHDHDTGNVPETERNLDQEVADILDLEPHTTDASNPEGAPHQDDDSRSESPVIIWRPSARVKLATDLPPELQSQFLHDYGETEHESLKKVRRSHPPQQPFHDSLSPSNGQFKQFSKSPTRHSGDDDGCLGPIDLSRSPKVNGKGRRPPFRSPKSLMVDSSFNFPQNKAKKKEQYGAWYIPPVRWRRSTGAVSRIGADGNTNLDFSNMKFTVAAKGKVNPTMMAKMKEMEHTIPKSYIKQAYKQFMKEQRDKPSKVFAHINFDERLPHYLKGEENVEFDESLTVVQNTRANNKWGNSSDAKQDFDTRIVR